jgi:hypothetical protein
MENHTYDQLLAHVRRSALEFQDFFSRGRLGLCYRESDGDVVAPVQAEWSMLKMLYKPKLKLVLMHCHMPSSGTRTKYRKIACSCS